MVATAVVLDDAVDEDDHDWADATRKTRPCLTVKQTGVTVREYLAGKAPPALDTAIKAVWRTAPRDILALVAEYAADEEYLVRLCCDTHCLQVVRDFAAWTEADRNDDALTDYMDPRDDEAR